jgi:Ca2+-binding EF-hand superfamily protein
VSQEKDQKTRKVKTKKRSKKVDSSLQESGEEDYLFSEADIYTLMVYFQSFCDDSNPDGINQEISLPDMEAAFRKYKQASITLEDEMYARELMVSFEWLLEENNLSPLEWFSFADVKGAIGGDGKLTYAELVDGLNKLCNLIAVPLWREADIFKLLKYMDPSADGDLTAAEVKLAFKRYYMPPESKLTLERAGPIIQKLEWYLQSQRLRVRDLFTRIDVDGSMSISMAELSEAMRKIIGKRPQKTNKEKKHHSKEDNVNESNSIYDYSDDDASVASDLSVSDMSVSSLGNLLYTSSLSSLIFQHFNLIILGESVYSNFSLNRGYKNNVYDGIPTRSFAHNRKFLNMPTLNAIPITKEFDKRKIRAGDLLPENNLEIVIEARKIVEVRDDTPNYLKPEVSQSVNVLAAFNLASGGI